MKACFVSVFITVCCVAGVCHAQELKPADGKPADPEPTATPRGKNPLFDRATPEGALRLFFAGMTLGSREVLDATMVPEEEEDVQILLIAPGGQRRPTMEEAKQLCSALKVRRLQVEEKFTMPDGNEITVGANEISDDQAVLHVEGHPIPTRMTRARGQWWVDARPIIAGRKKGQELLKKEAEEKARVKAKEDAK